MAENPQPNTHGGVDDFNIKCAAIAELLFVLLPFLVIAIVLGHRGEIRTVFYIPEWSLAAAVVIGQSVVRFTSTTVGAEKAYADMVGLIIACMIVLVLVPCLVVLTFVLTSDKVSFGLAAAQVAFFVIGAALFTFVTWIQRITSKR